MRRRSKSAGQLALHRLLSSRSPVVSAPSTKFGNTRVVVDSAGRLWSPQQARRLQIIGVTCDSVGEAHHFIALRDRQRLGEIRDLKHPHKFPLSVNGMKIGELWADFSFVDCRTGRLVVHDFKGRHDASRDVEYRFFVWKCKHLKAEHGIDVVEIRADAGSAREQWTRKLDRR
jgi:hypothetical protein